MLTRFANSLHTRSGPQAVAAPPPDDHELERKTRW